MADEAIVGNGTKVRLESAKEAHDECKRDRLHSETTIWGEISKLRDRLDRLPVWAVLVLMAESSAIGALTTFVLNHIGGGP